MTRLTRRAALAGGLSLFGAAAAAHAPLVALRPQARPVASGAASGALRQAPERPQARAELEQLVRAARLGDDVSFRLVDLGTGDVLAERRPHLRQPPASVTKAVTALYALAHLGPDHRFETRVLASGPIKDGIVQGDLALVGGGDPVLDTDALDRLAQALAAAGVRGVTGGFAVWGGALPYAEEIEPSQMDHLGYNPSVGGLNLNFNRVRFGWRQGAQGYDLTMDARSAQLRPEVSLAQIEVVQRARPVFRAEGRDRWSVARGALGGSGARWLPVRQPALYAGEVFQVLAGAHGVVVPAPRRAETRPLGGVVVAQSSAPLAQIAQGMLYHSTNLTAEVLGLAASGADNIAASGAAMSAWVGQGEFHDHSGLHDTNRISAAAMSEVLRRASARAQLPEILKQIPVSEAPAYPGDVVAKTGTLNFVSALAGYVRGASGRDMGFAIFCADPAARAAGKAGGEETPPGARAWNTRARGLQDALLRRWRLMS